MSSTALAPSQHALTRTTSASSSTSSLPILNLTPRHSTPATPPSQSKTTPNAAHSTPNATSGWLHPRMDEVIRRRNANNFESRNMKAVLLSVGVIIASFYLPNLITTVVPVPWQQLLSTYPWWILQAMRLLFFANALFACKPLLHSPDLCEDVPLTPQQRKLMGLPPMTRPATPQEKEQYVTPPRFSRSGTPRSTSSSVRVEGSDSPLSGRVTPVDMNGSFRMPGSGSPYGSPATQGSGGERRRLSYTSNTRNSPLTVSEFEAMGASGSPSVGRKENRASVGLNNKWLYEKGRRGSGGSGRAGVPQTPGGGRMPGMAALY